MNDINLIMVACCLLGSLSLNAQVTISGSTHLSLTQGTVITVTGKDVEIDSDATVRTQGEISTDADLIINGTVITSLNGPVSGTDYGFFNADGTVFLSGSLAGEVAMSYNPAEDAEHLLISAGTVDGNFTAEQLPGPGWRTEYAATEVKLIFDELVSNEEFSAEDRRLTAYPNPTTTDHFYLKAPYVENRPVEVYDKLGRLVVSKQPDRSVETGIRIDLPANLPAGTYLIRYGRRSQMLQRM